VNVLAYHVATGSGNPVIFAVNFAGPCSEVSTFCSGLTTTGGFTPAQRTAKQLPPLFTNRTKEFLQSSLLYSSLKQT